MLKCNKAFNRILTMILSAGMLLEGMSPVCAMEPEQTETVSDCGLLYGTENADETGDVSADTAEEWDHYDVSAEVVQFGGFPQAEKAEAVYEDDVEIGSPDGDVSAADVAGAKAEILRGLLERKTLIGIQNYNLYKNRNNIEQIYKGVFNAHPELFYVEGGFDIASRESDGLMTTIRPNYLTNFTNDDDRIFEEKVTEVLSGLTAGANDIEKILYVHDYVVMNTKYTASPASGKTPFNAYSVLVEGEGVCQGYALAFKYLCNRLGVQSQMVTSSAMSHAWNLVDLNGKIYYVDCTWDDIDSNVDFLCCHENLMRSRDDFYDIGHKSKDWVAAETFEGIYDSVTGSEDYDDAPWITVPYEIPVIDDLGIFIPGKYGKTTSTLYNLRSGAKSASLSERGTWSSWAETSEGSARYYRAEASENAFPSAIKDGDVFYYSTNDSIYRMDTVGNNQKICTIGDEENAKGDIYHIAKDGNKITYTLAVGQDVTDNNGNKFVNIIPMGSGSYELTGTVEPPTPTPGDNEEGLFSYSVSEDGLATLVKYNGDESVTKVTMENSWNGHTVTRIGEKAFENAQMTRLVIPETVTEIGGLAFQGCSALSQVIFEGDAPSISGNGFRGVITQISYSSKKNGWDAIKGRGFGGSLTYVDRETAEPVDEDWTLSKAEDFTYETVPDGIMITGIKDKDAKIESILIPDRIEDKNVTEIGTLAFSGVYGLEAVVIPATVKRIGDIAFRQSTQLERIYFKGDAPVIGNRAFFKTNSKAVAYYPENNETWTEEVRQGYGNTTLVWEEYDGKNIKIRKDRIPEVSPVDLTNMLSYEVVEDGIKITGYDFTYREKLLSLTSVAFPNKIADMDVVEISGEDFRAKTGWKTILFPTGLKRIGEAAFRSCTALDYVFFAGDMPSISENAFQTYKNLNVYYPEGNATYTKDKCVDYGTAITWIACPEDKMPKAQKDGSSGSPTPTPKDQSADFAYVDVTGGISITGYRGTDTVLSVPEKIDGKTVVAIGEKAFYRQFYKTEITLPRTLRSIGDNAFTSCYLKKMYFTGGAPDIAANAFTGIGAGSAMTIYYPRENATWTDDVKRKYGAYNVTYVAWDGAGEWPDPTPEDPTPTPQEPTPTPKPEPSASSNFVYDVTENGQVVIINYIGKDSNLVLPDTIAEKMVVKIDDAAFAGLSITSIYIPQTISEIGDFAFSRCLALMKVEFEGDAPLIGAQAFKSVSANVFVPYDKTSWNSETMVGYGGNLVYQKVGEPEVTPSPIVTPTPEPKAKDESLYVEFAGDDSFPYTGQAIEPAVNVYYRGKVLELGKDYTVKYTDNVNAGKKAKIKVTGVTVSATATKQFRIYEKNLSDKDMIVGAITVKKGKKVNPSIYYNGMKLGNKDYILSGETKFEKDGILKVKGKGNYTGTIQIPVTVSTPAKLKVKLKAEKRVYNGLAQPLSPDELTVYAVTGSGKRAGGDDLILNQDYRIVYTGSLVNAGTVKVTVVGIGEYTGTVTKSFRILPYKTKEFVAMIDGQEYPELTYKEGGVKPEVTVYDEDGRILRNNQDYRVTYSKYKKVGKASYTVKFLGNYKGCKSIKGGYDIVAVSLENAKLYLPDKAYSEAGNYQSAPYVFIDGKRINNKNFVIDYSIGKRITEADLDHNNSLIVEVSIEGKGNYEGLLEGSYKIQKASGIFNIATKNMGVYDSKQVAWVNNFSFDGDPIWFSGDPYTFYVFKSNWDTALVYGKDYTFTYMNNTKAGTGYLLVKGMGDYVGSKVYTFRINAGKMAWYDKGKSETSAGN